MFVNNSVIDLINEDVQIAEMIFQTRFEIYL